jgi:hypothetical protein
LLSPRCAPSPRVANALTLVEIGEAIPRDFLPEPMSAVYVSGGLE